MAPPSPRALLLAALLAATAGLALCQVNVRTTVVEDVIKRVTLFPTFKVPPELLRLIPNEKDTAAGQQLRANHRMIYRGDLPFADAKKVCQALAQKKKATITATKRKLSETVDVAGADRACAANLGMAGATPRTTFIVLLKRRDPEIVKMFTVLRCTAGSNQCQLWRLARPCPNGRCSVEEDRDLLSQVFSDTSLGDVLGADEDATKAILADFSELPPQKKDQQIAVVLGATGIQPQGAQDFAEIKQAVAETIEVLTTGDPKKTQKEGFTEHGALLTRDQYGAEVCAPGPLQSEEDPDADNHGDGGAAAASALDPATIANLPKFLNHGSKFNIEPKHNKQGSCNLPTLFAQIGDLDSYIPQKARSKCLAATKGDRQKCKLSRQFIADCMRLKCPKAGDRTALVQAQSMVYKWVKQNVLGGGNLVFEADYPSTNLVTYNKISDFAPKTCPRPRGTRSAPGAGLALNAGSFNSTALAQEDPNFLGLIGAAIRIIRFGFNVYKIGKSQGWWGRRLLQDPTANRLDFVKAQLQKGPMSVILSGNVLQYYTGGVINPATCCATTNCMNFAAQLVGYNDDESSWLLTAPLGENFGEGGYFKIAYSDAEEYGPCGLFFGMSQVGTIEAEEVAG